MKELLLKGLVMKVVVQILMAFAVVLVIFAATNVISIYQSTTAKSQLTSMISNSQELTDMANKLKVDMQTYNNSLTAVISSANEQQFNQNEKSLEITYDNLKKTLDSAVDNHVVDSSFENQILGSLQDIVAKQLKAKKQLLILDDDILKSYQDLGVSQISADIIIKKVQNKIDDEFLRDSVNEYVEKRNAAILNAGKAVFTKNLDSAKEYQEKISNLYSEVDSDVEYLMQDIPLFKSEKDFFATNDRFNELLNSDNSIASKKVNYLQSEKELKVLSEELNSIKNRLDAKIAEVNEEAAKNNQGVSNNVHSVFNTIIVVLLISMGLSLCVIFVVASILTRKISKPIRYLLDLMNRLATGDYSKKVGAHNWGYEFKVLANKLNHVIETNSALISKIQSNNQDIKSQSLLNQEEISSVVASSDKQNGAMHSILDSLNELGQIAKNTTEAMDNTRDHTQAIQNAVADSLTAIDANVNGNKRLNDTLENANLTISKVEDRTHDISKILDVIGEIADQTNLLALNAAIEAARAGEAGKGFAVVADEVRTLALKTAQSTSQIQEMINNLNAASAEASECMNICTTQMTENTKNLDITHNTIAQVNNDIAKLASQADNVTQMVNEQSASFDDISHNVNTVTSDLDESIKSLEKVRNSSMHLDDLSQEQQEILSEFKTLDVAVDS